MRLEHLKGYAYFLAAAVVAIFAILRAKHDNRREKERNERTDDQDFGC